MIYVSSSTVKNSTIKASVKQIAEFGFNNIELSGGTDYYSDYLIDLKHLKEEFNLNFLLHNYYPAPKTHFVCNLASLDSKVFNQTVDHYKRALDVSHILDAKKFGLHAGFLINPKLSELGKAITKQDFFQKQAAIDKFCEGLRIIQEFNPNVEIFVENNVFSERNMKNFEANPFLFTDFESYKEIHDLLPFNVLLDFAHLQVSCKTLNLSFSEQLDYLFPLAKYIHLSDNDGYSDSNKPISENSIILKELESRGIHSETITLEIYDLLEKVHESSNLISPLTSK